MGGAPFCGEMAPAGRKSQTEVVGTVILIGLVLGSIAATYTWGMPLIAKSGDANRIEYVKGVFGRLSSEFARVAREGGQATASVQIDKGDFKLELDQTNNYVLAYYLTTRMRFFAPKEITIDDSVPPYVQKDAWLSATKLSGTTACNNTATGGWANCDKNGTFASAVDAPDSVTAPEACLCANNTVKFIGGGSYYLTGPLSPGVEGTNYRLDKVDYANGFASVLSNDMETGIGLLGKDKPGAVLAESEAIGKIYRTHLKLKPRNIFDPSNNERLVIKAVPAEGTSTTSRGNFIITLRNEGSTLANVNGQKVRTVTVSIGMK